MNHIEYPGCSQIAGAAARINRFATVSELLGYQVLHRLYG